MSWHTEQLCGFDLETTGIDVETDRVVTAAIVLHGGTEETEKNAWLINPGVEIPAEVTGIHGITNARARAEGADPADALDEISAILADQVLTYGTPIVAMNARFDLTMLDRELRRHGQRTLEDRLGAVAPVIDPYVIDKKVDRYRKGSRSLTSMCAHYGVALDDAHEATADALAAVQVAAALGERYPQLRGNVMNLHGMQVQWAAQQARNLAAYFRRTPGKKSRAAGVRLDWPLIPHQQNGER